MEQLLNALRKQFPVLFSPQFWGIVGTAFFVLATKKAWFDQDVMEFLSTVFGFGTTVGIVNKTIKVAKRPVLTSSSSAPVENPDA